jgi:lipase
VAAPDLIGHGRSTWSAPWSIDANAAALAGLLAEPVVLVAHSFGCAVALRLAADRPDLVAALVLLDPAVGLPGGWMAEIADAMFASRTTPTPPRPAPRRRRGRGPTSTTRSWTPSSPSTWSHCPAAGSAGGSASRP